MMRGVVAVAAVAAVAVVAGCGGGGGAPDNPREGRKSTVGDGLSETPPPIAGSVADAAKAAGCTVQGWPADKGSPAKDNARVHLEANESVAYGVSNPPTSGPHDQVWADWGFYDQAVPYRYQIHNLEHGGIVVHYPQTLPKADVDALRTLWSDRPAYMIVTPDAPATTPKNGIVVTSWQRWMVCKPFAAKHLGAIRAFRDAYAGAGPENQVGDTSLSESRGGGAPGLPKPLTRDPSS